MAFVPISLDKCLTCIHNDDPDEEFLCSMTRHEQRDENEFKCGAYKPRAKARGN